jgi:hypothetical protein
VVKNFFEYAGPLGAAAGVCALAAVANEPANKVTAIIITGLRI